LWQTPRFLRALNTFITGFADSDTLHLQRSRVDANAPQGCHVDWIGSYCSYGDSDLQAVMALYFRRFAADDSIARHVPPERSIELVQRSAATVADAECKRGRVDADGIAPRQISGSDGEQIFDADGG